MKNQSNTNMEGKGALLVTPSDGVISVTQQEWSLKHNRYIAYIKENGKAAVSMHKTAEDILPLIKKVQEANARLRENSHE